MHAYVPKSATTSYQRRRSFIDGSNKVTILAACVGKKKQWIIRSSVNTTLNTLRAQLQRVNTNAGLLDTFFNAISDWFDHGAVNPSKYPEKYHRVILQQTGICWRHIYMGHIATAWSALQIPDDQTTDIAKGCYMWIASIAEVSLGWIIDL